MPSHLRAQQPDMAQDALISQKLHHMKAAKRYYRGWLSLIDFNMFDLFENSVVTFEENRSS